MGIDRHSAGQACFYWWSIVRYSLHRRGLHLPEHIGSARTQSFPSRSRRFDKTRKPLNPQYAKKPAEPIAGSMGAFCLCIVIVSAEAFSGETAVREWRGSMATELSPEEDGPAESSRCDFVETPAAANARISARIRALYADEEHTDSSGSHRSF